MLKYIIIICLFLNGCTTYKHNQLEKKIKSGEYKLVDLNINNKVHYHDKLDENGITINA